MNKHSFSCKHSHQCGFTLLEVLIAVAVFTIGILSVNAMQISSIKGNSTANRISEATTWAADRMEILFGFDYDSQLVDVDDDGTCEDIGSGDCDNPIKDGVDDDGGNFGLDDSQCCDDGNDPNGNTVAGCTEKSDGCLAQGMYSIYWNVAVDYPLPDIKTINVIVNRQDRGVTKSVTLTYMKSKPL